MSSQVREELPPRAKLIPKACWTWQNRSLTQEEALEVPDGGGGAAALTVDFTASAQGWPHICQAHSPGYLPKKRKKERRREDRRREERKKGVGGGRKGGRRTRKRERKERERRGKGESLWDLNNQLIVEMILSPRIW